MLPLLGILVLLLVNSEASSYRHARLSKLKSPSIQPIVASTDVPTWAPTDVYGDIFSTNLCYMNDAVYVAVEPALSTVASSVISFNSTTHKRLPNVINFNASEAIVQIFCSPTTRSIFTMIVSIDDPNDTQYVRQNSVETGKILSQFVLNDNLQVIWGIDPTGTMVLSGNLVATGGISVLDAVTGAIKYVLDGGNKQLELGGGAFHPDGLSVVLLDVTTASLYGIDIKSNKMIMNASLPTDVALYGSVIIDTRGYCAWVSYGTDNPFEMPFWNRFVQIELSTGKQLMKLEYDVPDSYAPAQFITASDDSPSSFWWLDQSESDVTRPARYVKQNGMNHTLHPISDYSNIPCVSGVAVMSNGSLVTALSCDNSVRIMNNGVYASSVSIDNGVAAGNNKHVSVDSQDRIIVPVNQSAIHIYSVDGSLLHNVALDKSVNPWAAVAGPDDTVFFIDFNQQSQVSQVDVSSGKIVSVITGSSTADFIDVAVDVEAGNVWVADFNGYILHYTMAGSLISTFDLTDSSAMQTVLRGVAVDLKNSRIVVARSSIDEQDLSTSTVLWLDQKTGAIFGQFQFPHAYEVSTVAVSADGTTVYAAGISKNEITVWKNIPSAN